MGYIAPAILGSPKWCASILALPLARRLPFQVIWCSACFVCLVLRQRGWFYDMEFLDGEGGIWFYRHTEKNVT